MEDSINTIIFNMGDLLIDSEPFWQVAEMEFFQKASINLTLEMYIQTAGLRIDKMIQY